MTAPSELPGYSLKPKINGSDLDAARDFFVGRMTQHRAGTDFRGTPNDTTDDHMGSALGGYYRRDLNWHFVWLPDSDETALYDLTNDPGQLTDASAAHPELLATFKADIEAWRARFESTG